MEKKINEKTIEPFMTFSRSKSTIQLLKFLFMSSSIFQANVDTQSLLVLPSIKNEESIERYNTIKEPIIFKSIHYIEKIIMNFISNFLNKILKKNSRFNW